MFGGTIAHAQVNIEPMVRNLKEGFGLTSGAGVDFNRGNTEILTLKSNLTLSGVTLHPKTPDDRPALVYQRLLLSARTTRQSANGELARNDGFSHLRYTYMWHPRVGPEAFTQVQFDEFRLLRRRTLLGGGLRVVALNRASVQLWFGTGYMAEWEERNVEPPDVVSVLNHRSATYATLQWNIASADRINLLFTGYAQPRLDAPADIQMLAEASLVIRLSERLSLSTDLNLRHDSRPPSSVQTTDITTGNSLVFTL
ncbi:MAG: DUF481 domain-containing protein [Myxococcota bacterium]